MSLITVGNRCLGVCVGIPVSKTQPNEKNDHARLYDVIRTAVKRRIELYGSEDAYNFLVRCVGRVSPQDIEDILEECF